MFRKFFFESNYTDGVRYASSSSRYLSIMIDLLVLILILVLTSYVISFAVNLFYSVPIEAIEKIKLGINDVSELERHQVNVYFALLITTQLIQLSLICVYTILLWYKFGTSPGKFLFGIRIVDASTFQKITLKQTITRFFSVIISVLPAFLGFVWSIFDKRSQAWHDKIAHTVLIVKDVE